MEPTIVIARAWGGEPVRRTAVEYDGGAVYIVNPDQLDAWKAGETRPAGFPAEDVFEFNEAVFGALNEQWMRHRATDPATWQQLIPFVTSDGGKAAA